ncbi:unnamed protein product, partial [Amoebophrya sp. A120]
IYRYLCTFTCSRRSSSRYHYSTLAFDCVEFGYLFSCSIQTVTTSASSLFCCQAVVFRRGCITAAATVGEIVTSSEGRDGELNSAPGASGCHFLALEVQLEFLDPKAALLLLRTVSACHRVGHLCWHDQKKNQFPSGGCCFRFDSRSSSYCHRKNSANRCGHFRNADWRCFP